MSVINVTKENFEEIIKGETVLLDFYADWCGPCQMVGPIVEEIAEENPQYTVGKINVDNEPELAAAFQVMSIPMLVAAKNGTPVDKIVGYRPKEDILAMLKQ